jgi:hypothetical protein
MAESGSWPSIRKHGLLSTSAILDLFGIKGHARSAIEAEWRKESVSLSNPYYETVVVRDQKPMPEKALQRCLDGLSPSEWYRLLNHKTFFWLQVSRLRRLLRAGAYRKRSHTVISVDTCALVQRHKDHITLSPINSGALFGGAGVKRGLNTFKPIDSFPYDEIKKRRRENAIVELAVEYSVPDISDLALSVEEWFRGRRSKVIWRRSGAV